MRGLRIDQLTGVWELVAAGASIKHDASEGILELQLAPEHRTRADALIVEAATEGYVSHQTANAEGGVTLQIAADPRVLLDGG